MSFFSEYGDELIQGGMLIIDELTRPDAPNIPNYKGPEYEELTYSDVDPNMPALISQQSDVALSMLSGELPSSVVEQISTTVGERALQGGFSASEQRTRNLLARDLGREQLDMMRAGSDLFARGFNMTENILNRHAKGQEIRQQLAYNEYASAVENMVNKYKNQLNKHNNRLEQITQIGQQAYQTSQNKKAKAEANKSFDKALEAYTKIAVDDEKFTPAERIKIANTSLNTLAQLQALAGYDPETLNKFLQQFNK
tara:strand:- start:3581 stop:4345 length:765 start_codon:yes stop_codon:yes gene_type:complete